MGMRTIATRGCPEARLSVEHDLAAAPLGIPSTLSTLGIMGIRWAPVKRLELMKSLAVLNVLGLRA